MAIVFEEQPSGLYDLKVDGRVKEYDVEPWDILGALSRARVAPGEVFVEDASGYRQRLRRR